MEPEWGVILAVGAVSLFREIYLLIKAPYEAEDNKSAKRLAPIISILIGLMVIIPFLGLVGIAIGIYAYRKTIYAGLSLTGIIINSLSLLLWSVVALNAV